MSKSSAITGFFQILFRLVFFASVRELHHHACDFCTVSVERIHLNRCTLVTVLSRVCFFRRLSGAKSREINAEMQAKTP